MKKLFALLDRLPRAVVLLYALFFSYLLLIAVADDQHLGYPRAFTVLSSLGHLSALIAVICFGLRIRETALQTLLRRIFPFAIGVLLCGVLLDATIPSDYSLVASGVPWLLNTFSMLLAVAPAYAIQYRYSCRDA